jgi:hypothetical protein
VLTPSPTWKVVGLVALTVGSTCHAEDDAPGSSPGPLAAIEVPRLTRSEVPIDGPVPSTMGREQVSELDYRWWGTRGRAAVGLGIGTLAHGGLPIGLARPTAGYVPGAAAAGPTDYPTIDLGPVLTVGVRYRTSERSTLYADAAGVRGVGLERDTVVGKVGMEFKSAQSRWNVTYGGLGLHLAGDTRMTLRLRKGGLGIVMRHSF